MGWLKKRLKESSTYTGLGLLGSVLVHIAGPEAVANASPFVALAVGCWDTLRKEKA